MTATYEPDLPTDKDHVRFLIGDTDTADAKFQDEEILAVIAEETATGEGLKYFAAATCLAILRTRWASLGEGVIEKEVDTLRIRKGLDSSAADALEARIHELRARGARLISPQPYVMRVL